MTAETYDDAHSEQINQSPESLRRKRLQLVAQTIARNAGVGESKMQQVIDAETALDANSDPAILRQRYGWSSARVRKALNIAAAYQIELSSGSFGVGDAAASWAPAPAPSNDQAHNYVAPPVEQATALPKPIQNLFSNILDEDQMTQLAGFSDVQIDFIVLEMGKLFQQHAQAQKLMNRHMSYMRQLLKGVSPREVAAKDGLRAETAIYPVFLNRLPKIFEPHKDAIVSAFEVISQLPADAEGPNEEDLIFDVREPAPKERAPQAPKVKVPSTPTEKKPKIPRTESSDRVQKKDEDDETFHSLDSTGFYMKQTGKVALLNAAEEVELAKDIEAGLYAEQKLAWLEGERIEIFKGKRRPSHDDSDLHDLGRMVTRGNQAKNHMLEANLRLVVSLAKRYTGRGMGFQDLIQEGNLGLIRAMEKFDYTKGFKFSTYATWWIRQALTRGLADQGKTIRIPVHTVEKINKLARIRREMYQDLGREATYEELAEESGIPVDKIEELMELGRDPVSLDMPVGNEDEAPFGDFIEDQEGTNPLEAAVTEEKERTIADVIATLDPREQEIVKLRFGFHDGTPLTLDQIGKRYGISRERVRQIEREVMGKLRAGERAEKLKAVNE